MMYSNNSSGIVLVTSTQNSRSNLTVNTADPEGTARLILDAYPSLNESVLDQIYNRFGGLEAFTAKNISSEMKTLRRALMRATNLSSKIFIEIFDNTPKISRDDASSYAVQSYFLTDLDKFMRIWKASRLDALEFMDRFHPLSEIEYDDGLCKHLPMIHANECRGDEPGNLLAHFFCEKPIIFYSDRNLDAHLTKRQELESIMDPKVIDFIHENILDCSGPQRALYSGSRIVRSDHWEKLAKDSNRTVLNNVAENPQLPSSVAEEIIASHKTPLLRESIAKNSVDNDLLNKIWNGTKSVSIRKVVEMNPMFTIQ